MSNMSRILFVSHCNSCMHACSTSPSFATSATTPGPFSCYHLFTISEYAFRVLGNHHSLRQPRQSFHRARLVHIGLLFQIQNIDPMEPCLVFLRQEEPSPTNRKIGGKGKTLSPLPPGLPVALQTLDGITAIQAADFRSYAQHLLSFCCCKRECHSLEFSTCSPADPL